MAQLLFAKNQINVKLAYYGPAGAGKASCFEALRTQLSAAVDAVELDGERALRLTCFPAWIDPIRERTVCLQLFTVPGDVFASTFPHRLSLQGADALVFVADSSPAAYEANLDAWRRLDAGLASLGESLAELPVVFQWNKRDLQDAVDVERLQAALNDRGAPACESVATTARGVLEPLKHAAGLATRGLEALDD